MENLVTPTKSKKHKKKENIRGSVSQLGPTVSTQRELAGNKANIGGLSVGQVEADDDEAYASDSFESKSDTAVKNDPAFARSEPTQKGAHKSPSNR